MDNNDKIIRQKMQAHFTENYDTESGWEKLQVISKRKEIKLPVFWASVAAAISAVILGFFGWQYLFRQHKEIARQAASNIVIHSETNNTLNQTPTVSKPDYPSSRKNIATNATRKQHYISISRQQPNNIVAGSTATTIPTNDNERLIVKSDAAAENKQANLIADNPHDLPKPLPVISINEIADAVQVSEEPKRHRNLLEKISSVQQINNTAGYSTFDKLKITFK